MAELRIDEITPFTDEIGVVELSTFSAVLSLSNREEMVLIVRKPYEVHLVTHHGDQTRITIKRGEQRKWP